MIVIPSIIEPLPLMDVLMSADGAVPVQLMMTPRPIIVTFFDKSIGVAHPVYVPSLSSMVSP